jgi:hypothetical protein
MSDHTEILDYLILNGAMEISGIDNDTGEFLYVFTTKLKDVMPELYEEHVNHVNSEIMRLWEKGLVNIDFMDDNPIVVLSEKAYIQEELMSLPKEDLWAINEIKRLLNSTEL